MPPIDIVGSVLCTARDPHFLPLHLSHSSCTAAGPHVHPVINMYGMLKCCHGHNHRESCMASPAGKHVVVIATQQFTCILSDVRRLDLPSSIPSFLRSFVPPVCLPSHPFFLHFFLPLSPPSLRSFFPSFLPLSPPFTHPSSLPPSRRFFLPSLP